ncbi:GNAT family N-acetyltransferase [Zhengella mangrovi]|uniref:GNAT family N-acetyltransferase n=1 Tax=Zhengella mangrovi TaxID=1982044 RepID=UPI0013FE0FA1|nr:GNAT family N-acetyltransferase [Zhengella mangrovi]
MPSVAVRLAETEQDVEAVRALCRAFVDWQLKEFPGMREKILAYFEPVSFARTLADLPEIHARPKGAILLASLDGRPVGCVMYLEMQPGVAEVKRLFVEESGRGHGIGRILLAGMLEQMRTDGYNEACLDSAEFLTHAKQLYDRMGFVDIARAPDDPGHAYFMRYAL